MRKSFPHICLIFYVLFFTHITFTQDKPEKNKQKSEPVLFDTYSEKTQFSESLLIAYAERFAEALKETPASTKSVIIFYHGSPEEMCSKDDRFDEKRFKFLERVLTDRHKIATDRVSSSLEFWRECNEVEFWLVPKDAKLPDVRPTLILHYQCGTVSVKGAKSVDASKQFIYFTAEIYNGGEEIGYKWTVSAGEIVKGQGTNSIKVDISNFALQKVVATVEAKDFNVEFCSSKDSYTTKIIP